MTENNAKALQTIVVDDEWLIRKELISLLTAYDQINIVGEASNVDEAIQLVENIDPDLIFLDIQMPGRTGFHLLESIPQTFDVIFISGYDHMIQQAHQYNAIDYLTKPIDKKRLALAVNKALEKRVFS
ncbi:response regulator [candidate division KSB1 bacterium]|nr:response regulator [candidate division KSB1 bacterium]